MDLLTYQLAHEQSLIKSAHMAYATGNVSGAINFLTSLAAMLGVQLPKRPMAAFYSPNRSAVDVTRAQDRYFHTCSEQVSWALGRNISEIRAKYGMPLTLINKPKKKAASQEGKAA